jgi:hypothetical protein
LGEEASGLLLVTVSNEVEVDMDVSERLVVKDGPSLGEEGITCLIVERETSTSVVDSSGRGGNLASRKSLSSGGVDGGETDWERRLDEGVTKELAMRVSASDVVVEVDARADLRGWSGLGINVSSEGLFAKALVEAF